MFENYEFYFSQLNPLFLSKIKVNYDEIRSIFFNENARMIDFSRQDSFTFLIGYSNKSKFLSLIFDTKSEKADISILDVYISYENEIKTYYCG